MIKAKSEKNKAEYMIFKPKQFRTKNGSMWTFSIADSKFNKETKTWDNQGFINCMTFQQDIELNDKDKIVIKEITGVTAGKYVTSTGKEVQSVTVVLEIETNSENSTYTEVDYSADELPF